MAGNWGAILAGLAGGAGSLAKSMDTNEQRAEEQKKQAIAEAIQMLAVKDTYGLTELPEGRTDKDALTLGAVEQLAQTKPGVQTASIGGPFDTSYKSGETYTEQREPQIEHGPQRIETIGARRFLADPSQGKEARAERRGEESAERKADADWRRLQATLTGQEKIANLRAKTAADQAASALAARFQLQDKSLTAAQTRAETMADAQRGMVGSTVQVMEDGTPVVMGVTRGGETRKLGTAVPPSGRGQVSIRQAIADNQKRIGTIDLALKAVQDRPQSFGLQFAMGLLPGLGTVADQVNQRNDPEGVPARSLVANIASLEIKDRSGAAVTVSEFPRLTPFIPQVGDTPEKIMTNLRQLRQIIELHNAALARGDFNSPDVLDKGGSPGLPATVTGTSGDNSGGTYSFGGKTYKIPKG